MHIKDQVKTWQSRQVSTYRVRWIRSSEAGETRKHKARVVTENLARFGVTRDFGSQEVCITRMVIFQQVNMGLMLSLGL